MPYNRRPLESPYSDAFSGLGQMLALFLTRPLREKAKKEENVRAAWEEAKLSGNPAALTRLREESPEAVAKFEREHGLELPPFPVPQTEGGMRPVSPAQPGALPPQMMNMPGTPEPPPIPWPTTPAGMQVRGGQEQLAGRPVPPFMQPEPGDVMAQSVRTIMSLPPDQRQGAYAALRNQYKDLPEITFPAAPPPERPDIREIAVFEELWGSEASESERKLAHEQGIWPTRQTDPLPPDRPRALSVAELAQHTDATAEQLLMYQFTGKVKGTIKRKTEEPKQIPTTLMKWASAIAERTNVTRKKRGEPPEAVWDIAQGIMKGTYNFTDYQDALQFDERVQEKKMMLIQARQMKNNAMTKQLSKELAEMLNIEWKSGNDWLDYILSLITPSYGQSIPQTGAEPPGTAKDAANKWKR